MRIELDFQTDKNKITIIQKDENDGFITGYTSLSFQEWKAKKDKLFRQYHLDKLNRNDLIELIIAQDILLEES